MRKTGGLSPVQFVYSLGLHIALLLPLLAMPITLSASGRWRVEDYVLYLMLKSHEPPDAENGNARTASGGEATPREVNTAMASPLEKDVTPPDSGRSARTKAEAAAETERVAVKESPPDESSAVKETPQTDPALLTAPQEMSLGATDNPLPSSEIIAVEPPTVDTPSSRPDQAVPAAEAPPAVADEETAVPEPIPAPPATADADAIASAPLPQVPGVSDFFVAGEKTTVADAAREPAAAAPHTPASAKVMAPESVAVPPEMTDADATVAAPLPQVPLIKDFFVPAGKTIVAAADKGHPPAAVEKRLGRNNLRGADTPERKAGVKSQEAPGRVKGNTLEDLIRSAAVAPFSREAGTSQVGKPAVVPSVDLTHTPGFFLPQQGPFLAADEKSSPGNIPAAGSGSEEVSVPPARGAAGMKSPDETKEEGGLSIPPPSIPLAQFVPLKIAISSDGDDLGDISTRLVRRGYPSVKSRGRKEIAANVDMREETVRPAVPETSLREKVMSVPIAERGTYAFHILNTSETVRLLDVSFRFYDGAKVIRVRHYPAVGLPGGAAATYRFIMPDAIFWDEEDRFAGSIEDSDSITKFNDATGLFWREEKDH
jgi:hypothetical protein